MKNEIISQKNKIISQVENSHTLMTENDLKNPGTYIVSTDVAVVFKEGDSKSRTIVISEGVTLIFQGGKIVISPEESEAKIEQYSLYLQGNNTALEAPINQIFGTGVEATGTWCIDKAYPQWFDALAGSDEQKTTSPHDSSIAINKAIKMKTVGEVFLPKGNYFIHNPIDVPVGISLCGEGERILYKQTPDGPSPYSVSTYLIPYMIKDGKIEDKFKGRGIVRINIKKSELDWEQSYPISTSKISNIRFSNRYTCNIKNTAKTDSDISNVVLVGRQVCCLVAGGFTFDNVSWENFPSAIKWLDGLYCDNKHVTDCTFTLWDFQNDQGVKDICSETYPPEPLKDENGNVIENPDLALLSLTPKYLIDLRGNGDGLTIKNCETDNGSVVPSCQDYFKSVCLLRCMGGSISDSILNRDVVIKHSSAITYRNNHMEMGAQLFVEDCNMEISENIIEKGRRPSLVFGTEGTGRTQANGSNIVLSGNIFRIYTPPTHKAGTSERTPIKDISEYDMAITTKFNSPVSLIMTANYRMTTCKYNSHQATGIMIAKLSKETDQGTGNTTEVMEPFEEFNRYSHFLSVECTILENFQLAYNKTYNSIPTLSDLWMMSNDQIDNVNWPLNKLVKQTTDDSPIIGTLPSEPLYEYFAQVIIDERRGIVGNFQEFGYYESNGKLDYKPALGNLIILQDMVLGPGYILRLVRLKKSDRTKVEYVNIPLISGKFLYDNYYSVNGYVWKPIVPASMTTTWRIMDSGMLNVEYFNSKARCMTEVSGSPSAGTWNEMDEIINFGTNDSGHFCYVKTEQGSLGWKKI